MRLALAVLLLCLPVPAFAIQETTYTTDTFNQTFVYPGIPAFAPPPPGGLAWDVFTTTEQDHVMEQAGEANIIKESRPVFSKDLEAYDGKTVTMSGYMFPLEDSETQARFLFGPFPVSCPYHYHVPPTLVLETRAKTPVPFTYDRMTLTGTLHLVRGKASEPYYTLDDAALSPDQSVSIVRDAPKTSGHPLIHASPMTVRKSLGATPSDAPSAGDYKAR